MLHESLPYALATCDLTGGLPLLVYLARRLLFWKQPFEICSESNNALIAACLGVCLCDVTRPVISWPVPLKKSKKKAEVEMVEFQTLTLILECVASACLSMSKHWHDILPAMSQLILLLTLPSPGIMMCILRILVVSALNCQSGVSGFKSCWVLLLDKVLSISNFFFREYESDGSRG